MPIKALANLDTKSKSGVQVCASHGPACEKYPDHPLAVERAQPDPLDLKLMEMIYGGRLSGHMDELLAAGYELPEEFTRGPASRARDERGRLFFDTYDLDRHFPAEPKSKPRPCKPRKLSPEEVRQRIEWARAVREARDKRKPPPLPPWEALRDQELRDLIDQRDLIYNEDTTDAYRDDRQTAEEAARIKALADDEELRHKLAGALETWVNSPRRVPKYTQDVREGYGNAVPAFEEE
ncbi:hypothetical protein [Streptomyces sp. NPDC002587]